MTTWPATILGLILTVSPSDSGVMDVPRSPTTARSAGMMGFVRDGDGWSTPDTIVAREREDARLVAVRSEYADRRKATGGTARGQRDLALWCEGAGLRFESLAHFEAVARLDLNDADAHRRLGHRKHRGQWMTGSEAAAEGAEVAAQRAADALWSPRIASLRVGLAESSTRADAARDLLAIRDPLAVAAVRRYFGDRIAWEQAWAVRILDGVDSPRSSRELAWLSVFGIDETVRLAALKSLDRRDPRAFISHVIRWFRPPIRYQVQKPVEQAEATLVLEGPTSIVERHYKSTPVNGSNAAKPSDRESKASLEAVKQRQQADVHAIQQTNSTIDLTDSRVERTLFRATGVDLGQDPQAWNRWWSDEQGYSYQSPPSPDSKPIRVEEVQVTYVSPPAPVPIPVQVVGRVHHACFGAGTPVLSRDGFKAIEDLRVGDQVLTQDTASAAVDFRPILAVFHNRPTTTLRISFEGETIVATPIHRFWIAGKGWAMARDLKPGGRVRKLGGTSEVISVVRDEVQPVFNLEVAGGHSFFVGRGKTLVHDNSPVLPVAAPFDR